MNNVILGVKGKIVDKPAHVDALAVIMYCAEIPEPEAKDPKEGENPKEPEKSFWSKLFGSDEPKAWGDLTDDEKAPFRAQASEIIKNFRLTPRHDLNVSI